VGQTSFGKSYSRTLRWQLDRKVAGASKVAVQYHFRKDTGARKPIVFSQDALETVRDRGATCEEVQQTIRQGEEVPAKRRRMAFRKNFPHQARWKGRYYESKQVVPIVAEQADRLVIVTVYTFLFGGEG